MNRWVLCRRTNGALRLVREVTESEGRAMAAADSTLTLMPRDEAIALWLSKPRSQATGKIADVPGRRR